MTDPRDTDGIDGIDGIDEVEADDVQRLRAAVYRPGVTARDVEALEAALRAAEASIPHQLPLGARSVAVARKPQRARRSKRTLPLVLGTAGSLLVVVPGIVSSLASRHEPAPAAPSGPVSTPIPFSGTRAEQRQQRYDLDLLFRTPTAEPLRSYSSPEDSAASGSCGPMCTP